jgi:hypothetical protein
LPQRLAGASTEVVQFELIGCDDVGGWHGLVLHKLRDALAYKNAAADIADHRIAAIFCTGIGPSDVCKRFKNSHADFGGTHIAGENTVALAQNATLFNARDNLPDHARVEDSALPAPVTGVIGELHGVNRPDFDTHSLQWKRGSVIANVAIGHVRLYREYVHRGRRSVFVNSRREWPGQARPSRKFAGLIRLRMVTYFIPVVLFAASTYLFV